MQLSLLLDGHGGTAAVDYCIAHLLDLFIEACDADPSVASTCTACTAAFKEAHRQLRSIQGCTSGCTATLVAINEDRWTCVCANVGDANVILISDLDSQRSMPSYRMLCANHRISSNPEERERILSEGFQVGRAALEAERGSQPGGPLRAYPGGLVFSRALGDADCGGWLIPDPHVSAIRLKPESKCMLVLASNGVWDMVEPSLAAVIARHARDVHAAAAMLVQRATNARNPYFTSDWNIPLDDTTAIALSIGASVPASTVLEAERKKRQVWTIRLAIPVRAPSPGLFRKTSLRWADAKRPGTTTGSSAADSSERSESSCSQQSRR